jgi:hypothetical protein
MAPVNLGTARIVIVVALVAVGAAVLANGFADPSVAAGGSPSPSASVTGPTGETGSTSPSPPPTPQAEAPKNVAFAVFNGTEVDGLAADAAIFLEDEGFRLSAPADDAPESGVGKTVVYFRGGAEQAQNKANAAAVVEALGVGKLRELGTGFDDLVSGKTEVVIVLGADYEFKT